MYIKLVIVVKVNSKALFLIATTLSVKQRGIKYHF